MPDDVCRKLYALHEAGHHVMAAVCGWQLGAVTIEPGALFAGCSEHYAPPIAMPGDFDPGDPFVLWPAALRQGFESRALVFMAGDMAGLLFAPRTGRVPDTVTEAAATLLASGTLAAPTENERAAMTAAVSDTSARTDAEVIADLAWLAHPLDPAGAGAWMGWLDTQARAVLLDHEDRVRRLADVLLAAGTVGAAAAARVLELP
jgi:hypothetical protein